MGHTGVSGGETVLFDVTLFDAQTPIREGVISLISPKFGRVEIYVQSAFPCYDCAQVAGGSGKWDQCGECNGLDLCLGCDGVPNSGAVVDSCGICGGTGQCNSCPTNDTDDCGVCAGSNLCVGCDGKAFSLAFYDLCGVCNGNNDCLGCDGQLYLGANDTVPQFDECGVCAGDNSACSAVCECPFDANGQCTTECFDCKGVPNGGTLVDECGVCGGDNGCIHPLCGVPFQKPDACGICGGDSTSCIATENETEVIVVEMVEEMDTEPIINESEATILGLAIGLPAVLVVGFLAVAAYFAYKQRQNPYWALPKSMFENVDIGLEVNPLFQEANPMKDNPLFSAD